VFFLRGIYGVLVVGQCIIVALVTHDVVFTVYGSDYGLLSL
jgi:hypothetical protein